MFIFRTLAAMLLLSGSTLVADEVVGVQAVAASSMAATAPSSAVLPSSALPHNPRTAVLVIGVAAVLVTFHRALSAPRKSA